MMFEKFNFNDGSNEGKVTQNESVGEGNDKGKPSLKEKIQKLGMLGALGASVVATEGCKPNAEPVLPDEPNAVVEKATERSRIPEDVLNNWMDVLLKNVSYGRMERSSDGNIYLEYFGKIIFLDEMAQKILKDGVERGVKDVSSTDSDMVKNMKFQAIKRGFELNVGALGKEVSDPSVLSDQMRQRFNELSGLSNRQSVKQGSSEKVSKKDHIPASQAQNIGLGQSPDSGGVKQVRQSPDFDKDADF